MFRTYKNHGVGIRSQRYGIYSGLEGVLRCSDPLGMLGCLWWLSLTFMCPHAVMANVK